MRPTNAIIDLSKLDANINLLKNIISPGTELMAIVKADSYGHGAVEIAKRSLASGAKLLGVAIPEEGVILRESGIRAQIVVLGQIFEEQLDAIYDYDLTQTVFSTDMCDIIDKKAREKNKKVKVHIKLDTGMGRIGIRNIDELKRFLNHLHSYKNIQIDGVFTHLSSADEEDKTYTYHQLHLFNKMLTIVKRYKHNISYIHASNSGGIINYPDANYNLVRAGLSMYGYNPTCKVNNSDIDLQPILEWKTKIAHINEIQAGDHVSYGRSYTATKKTRVATIPVGYGDGYNRLMSNKGWVLIRGKKAPVIGRVCMDQTMVDITSIPDAHIGDSVTLIGCQDTEFIWADTIADICGTISYEVLCNIGKRVPRIYRE